MSEVVFIVCMGRRLLVRAQKGLTSHLAARCVFQLPWVLLATLWHTLNMPYANILGSCDVEERQKAKG